jgi:hypothetical protein
MKPPPEVEEFIEHHGVKGMKWGVRKEVGVRGIPGVGAKSKTTGKRLPQTRDSKRAAELKRREPFQLTDKQLKEVNNRLNLEQNYNRMNHHAVKRGAVAAAAIIATAKTGEKAYKFYKSPQGQAAIKIAKKALKKTG